MSRVSLLSSPFQPLSGPGITNSKIIRRKDYRMEWSPWTAWDPHRLAAGGFASFLRTIDSIVSLSLTRGTSIWKAEYLMDTSQCLPLPSFWSPQLPLSPVPSDSLCQPALSWPKWGKALRNGSWRNNSSEKKWAKDFNKYIIKEII